MSIRTPLHGIRADALRRSFRAFRPALAGQRRRLVASLLLALVAAALELLRPWPLKIMFDRVLVPDGRAHGIAGLSPEVSLVTLAGAVLLISVLIGVVTSRMMILVAEVGRRATTRVRRRVFEHLHRLELPYHQTSHTGDLLVRLMGDVNMVRDMLFASWLTVIERGTVLVGTAAVMLVLDPVLGLVALVPLPLLWAAIGRTSNRLKETTRKQRRKEGRAAAFAAETLSQIRLVKAYAAEDRATATFSDEARAGEKESLKSARITARMSLTTEVLTGAGLALVLLVGARKVLAGQLSIGELIVFTTYARSVYKPLRKLSNEGGRLAKATACAERLLEVLDVPPEDVEQGEEAPEFRGEIELRDVHYGYPGGQRVLDGVSVRLAAGELAVVSGPNGCGKSTTLSLLLRLMTPDAGKILVDGTPVEQFRLDAYRRRFAYVPQDIQLFGASIRDNVLYGRPDASDEEVEEAARLALVDDVIDRIGGYDVVLGEGGATLSGGEARRIMLARAALRDARILLLDEPLAGVDPDARALVSAAIRRIGDGRTTIVVNHGPLDEIEPDVVVALAGGKATVTRPAAAPTAPTAPGRPRLRRPSTKLAAER